jgi:glycosyltransferase involved in cell wall biosynthesis
MIDLVRRLGLEDRVSFDGNVEDTPEWYRKIDIFISNSYSEGLQVSPLEAIASGCYCLSHRWPGSEEMLPEANLYDSDRELIQRLLEFWNLPRPEKQARIEGLQSIVRDRFDVDRTRVQIGAVIEEVGAGWRREKA